MSLSYYNVNIDNCKYTRRYLDKYLRRVFYGIDIDYYVGYQELTFSRYIGFDMGYEYGHSIALF